MTKAVKGCTPKPNVYHIPRQVASLAIPGDMQKPETATECVTIYVALRTGTGLNEREHWAARAKRVQREKWAMHAAWLGQHHGWRPNPGQAFEVHLTRVSPRGHADDDNVVAGLKAVRDQVARELGLDDGSRLLTWRYAQERGDWAVRIEITPRAP